MSDAPSVLFLVYDLIRGGTEGQCARAAMALRESGVPVRVGVFRKKGFFLDAIEAACGPVFHFDIQRMLSGDTAKKIQRLADWIQAEGIQVVHGWDMDAGIFGYPAARKAGVPFINSRRNTAGVLPPHKKFLLNRVDRKSFRVVVNAACIKDMVVGHGVRPTRVIQVPNLIDHEEFPMHTRQPQADALQLGMVARLEPEKNVAMAIRALAQVHQKRPGTRLRIAGGGSWREELETRVCNLGLEEAVDFLGETSGIAAFMQTVDVGLLVPQSNEGLSNALLEFLASGLPVIATDQGGNRELLTESGGGELVRVGDHSGLANTILKWAADLPALMERGRKGRSYIQQRHDRDGIVKQLNRLYVEAVSP